MSALPSKSMAERYDMAMSLRNEWLKRAVRLEAELDQLHEAVRAVINAHDCGWNMTAEIEALRAALAPADHNEEES